MSILNKNSDDKLINSLSSCEPVFWQSDKKSVLRPDTVTLKDVIEAEKRLERFAGVVMKLFPETVCSGGIIESGLTAIPDMAESLGISVPLYIKRDDSLPIAGSVKARGGIYEVLKHTEEVALKEGIISGEDDDYMKIASNEAKRIFANYKIQVGSTGNLGMSIGIMSAAIGYNAIVHMSNDAKQWKKDKLRDHGATVLEYDGDYGEAVKHGRELSGSDEKSYFVDDENSRDLFCGYAVAGNRLKKQLEQMNITVSEEEPLYVYIPCGVGGAPGGISFGLKLNFGEFVHCYLAEPVQAPCMLLGIYTGLFDKICVQDVGLTGKTNADGLAVGRCSSFAGKTVAGIIDGEATVCDEKLSFYQKELWKSEKIYIEPSACAAFEPLMRLNPNMGKGTHMIWATGGSMVPDNVRRAELGY